MDSKAAVSQTVKSSSRGRILFQIALGSYVLLVLLAIFLTTYSIVSQGPHIEVKELSGTGISLRARVQAFISKINALYDLEKENARLRLRNAQLQQIIDEGQFERDLVQSFTRNLTLERHLKIQTGSSQGRTLESIQYQPPVGVLPFQLYTLGITYFKEHSFEKAAVIFSKLIKQDEKSGESIYSTEINFLAAGISWYRLENYQQAEAYFDAALKKFPEEKSELQKDPVRTQIRLWKALIAYQLTQEDQVQYWLNKLLEHNPASVEAQWVVPKSDKVSTVAKSHKVRQVR